MHTQQRSTRQVERTAAFPVCQFLAGDLARGPWQCTQIDNRRGTPGGWMNHLNRLAVASLERCAQNLMPLYQRLQGASQRSHHQLSLEPPGQGNDIRAAAGFQLIQKPEALLREGER